MNWVSSKHNMGMSFNREVWDKIKTCSEVRKKISSQIYCCNKYAYIAMFGNRWDHEYFIRMINPDDNDEPQSGFDFAWTNMCVNYM